MEPVIVLAFIAFLLFRGATWLTKGASADKSSRVRRLAAGRLSRVEGQLRSRREPAPTTASDMAGTDASAVAPAPPASWVPDAPAPPAVAAAAPDPVPLAEDPSSYAPIRQRIEIDVATAATAAQPRRRTDIGSTALESTLDSTIESSLFGSPPGLVIESIVQPAQVGGLPIELQARVLELLRTYDQAAAVQLVREELKVDMLDAIRIVRTVAGQPGF